MLENDHMNQLQLLHARFPDWLMHFWFERDGASLAVEALSVGRWAECDERLAIAMWLFWFFLDPSECVVPPSLFVFFSLGEGDFVFCVVCLEVYDLWIYYLCYLFRPYRETNNQQIPLKKI